MQRNPKKHSKNQNCRFYYVNLASKLRNHQKSPKNFAIAIYSFFLLVWYFLDATLWILMSTRFRICMGKGGVKRQVKSGRSWPSFCRKKLFCGVTKKYISHRLHRLTVTKTRSKLHRSQFSPKRSFVPPLYTGLFHLLWPISISFRFWVFCPKSKEFSFLQISVAALKKNWWPIASTIFMPPTFHLAT